MARSQYEALDYDNLTESGGLKPFLSNLKSEDLRIAAVESDNKAKRTAGVPTKKANVIFEDGQILTLLVNASGVVYRMKLNGSDLPITNTSSLKSAAREAAAKVMANSKLFQKAARKRARLIDKANPAKAISTSTKKKAEQAKLLAEELSQQVKEAEQELAKTKSEVEEVKADVVEAESTITTLNTEIDSLMARISQMEAA